MVSTPSNIIVYMVHRAKLMPIRWKISHHFYAVYAEDLFKQVSKVHDWKPFRSDVFMLQMLVICLPSIHINQIAVLFAVQSEHSQFPLTLVRKSAKAVQIRSIQAPTL